MILDTLKCKSLKDNISSRSKKNQIPEVEILLVNHFRSKI